MDDLIVTGAREKDIASFKAEMAARFQMTDLDALSYYLGIEVRQGSRAVTLGQRAYARKLLERAGMANCKPAATLMEERVKLSKQSTAEKVDATRYRSIIGGLRWLTHTRPDIAFAVGYVSRFMEDPREDHWMAVKRVLRYIQGSMDQVLVFPKSGGSSGGELELAAFSDVDMAGDVDGWRSTSGVLILLGAGRWCYRLARQSMSLPPPRHASWCGCTGCWGSSQALIPDRLRSRWTISQQLRWQRTLSSTTEAKTSM